MKTEEDRLAYLKALLKNRVDNLNLKLDYQAAAQKVADKYAALTQEAWDLRTAIDKIASEDPDSYAFEKAYKEKYKAVPDRATMRRKLSEINGQRKALGVQIPGLTELFDEIDDNPTEVGTVEIVQPQPSPIKTRRPGEGVPGASDTRPPLSAFDK